MIWHSRVRTLIMSNLGFVLNLSNAILDQKISLQVETEHELASDYKKYSTLCLRLSSLINDYDYYTSQNMDYTVKSSLNVNDTWSQ